MRLRAKEAGLPRRASVTTAAVILALLGAATITTAEEPIVTPPLLGFGHGIESAAQPDGPASLLFNPAAIGVRYPGELAITMLDLRDGESQYRVTSASEAFAFGWTGADGHHSSFDVGFAGGTDPLRLGLVTTWVPRHSGGRQRDLRIGALSRPVPWLSIGSVVDHLSAPNLDGVRLQRTYVLGLGVRPLALSPSRAHDRGPRLTLTGDVLLDENQRLDDVRWRAGSELEVVPGVAFRGLYLSESRGVQVGLTLLGVRTAAHGQAGFDRNGGRSRYSTASLSFHHGEDRTVLAAPSQRRVSSVRIGGALGDDALTGFSLLYGPSSSRAVDPIHRRLERALEDPLTRGVLLELGGASNMAQLEELRPRIQRLRAAGKPVVAYLESGGGRGDLFLASACDGIVATPEAMFAALGLRVERRYYRKLLADWGVRIDRTSYGKYKSAYRSYSVDSTDAADREVIESTLDRVQEMFVSTVSAERRIPRERLLTLLDGRRWRSADLVAAGLIDSVGYREDAYRMLGRMAGLGDKPPRLPPGGAVAAKREWTIPAPIAVVYASGEIATGESGNDLLFGPYVGAATLSRQIERAFQRNEVNAVVLRVESPGGSSLGSDLVHHAIARMKQETGKPLIVSMGSVAASGGYQISLPADRIYADRFTRTGSIGVLFVRPSLERWYEMHEVRQDEFERGRYMRGWSLGRDWDAEIQASADSSIQHEYRDFVDLVARSRKMSWDETHEVAQGRVWFGEEARDRRLVDEIGGLEAAISEARRRAGVPEGAKIRLTEFRRPRPGLLQRLIGPLVREAWERAVRMPDLGETLRRSDPDTDP